MRFLALLGPLFLLSACDDEVKDTGPFTTDTNPCPDPADDLDGDCFAPPEDCNDNDPYVNPDAPEVPYNGKDDNCDGEEVNDFDGDGFDGGPNGDDCNDNDPNVYPGAVETCDQVYAGVDANCDGSGASDDCDGDGFDRWEDCQDDNPEAYPGAAEVWYNGLDDDCSGHLSSDYDADYDGQDHVDYCDETECDCDDTNPEVYYNAQEIWDLVDNDCDGTIDRVAQADAAGEWMGDGMTDLDYYVGWEVAWTSDFDGDGLKDILAADPYANPKEAYGRIYILPGSGPVSGHTPSANMIKSIEGTGGTYLGYDMVNPGDLDGDGYDEVLAGAPVYSVSGNMGAGLLFLSGDILSMSSLAPSDAHTTLSGGDYYGVDLTSIDDVDGDGIAELVVGSGELSTCSLSVFSGKDAVVTGGNITKDSALISVTSINQSGDLSAGGGDFDGDGLGDLLIGTNSHSYDEEGGLVPLAGNMYVLTGEKILAGGNLGVGTLSAITGSNTDGVGYRNSWTHDADGDGYDEVLVSTPFADGSAGEGAWGGAVYVVPGNKAVNGGSPASLASLTVMGTIEYGCLVANSSPVDFNMDGMGDLALTHIGEGAGGIKGYVYTFWADDIVSGGSIDVDSSDAWFLTKYEDDRFGFASDFADYDGDGDQDVLISAYEKGAVWFFVNNL